MVAEKLVTILWTKYNYEAAMIPNITINITDTNELLIYFIDRDGCLNQFSNNKLVQLLPEKKFKCLSFSAYQKQNYGISADNKIYNWSPNQTPSLLYSLETYVSIEIKEFQAYQRFFTITTNKGSFYLIDHYNFQIFGSDCLKLSLHDFFGKNYLIKKVRFVNSLFFAIDYDGNVFNWQGIDSFNIKKIASKYKINDIVSQGKYIQLLTSEGKVLQIDSDHIHSEPVLIFNKITKLLDNKLALSNAKKMIYKGIELPGNTIIYADNFSSFDILALVIDVSNQVSILSTYKYAQQLGCYQQDTKQESINFYSLDARNPVGKQLISLINPNNFSAGKNRFFKQLANAQSFSDVTIKCSL